MQKYNLKFSYIEWLSWWHLQPVKSYILQNSILTRSAINFLTPTIFFFFLLLNPFQIQMLLPCATLAPKAEEKLISNTFWSRIHFGIVLLDKRTTGPGFSTHPEDCSSSHRTDCSVTQVPYGYFLNYYYWYCDTAVQDSHRGLCPSKVQQMSTSRLKETSATFWPETGYKMTSSIDRWDKWFRLPVVSSICLCLYLSIQCLSYFCD